jgi:outer membrane protein assembly factor BamB
VIVATENDTVYSLNSTTGALRWSRHLGTPVPGSSLPCGDIDPSGITGTPVADPVSGLLWVVTLSLPTHHSLWTLDLSTGAVRAERDADPPGADPAAEQQRAALALSGSMVYVAYGGLYGDCGDYHGWVVGFGKNPGSNATVTYETPTQREGGIWAPPGPVVAPDGTLYVATGNGEPVDAVDDSDSVVHLSAGLKVLDTFTPTNYVELSENDADLGSTSPALVDGSLVFQIGKDGVGYLMSAGHLGGLGGSLASLRVCSGGFGATAVDGDLLAVSCFDGLFAVRLTPAGADGRPSMAPVWTCVGRPGPPVIAGGVVWTVDRSGRLTGCAERTGQVVASAAVRVVSSFPTLAAAGGRLVVASGDGVQSFLLVAG